MGSNAHHKILWVSLTILMMFFSRVASPTSVLPLDFDQLLQDAQIVFQGRCLENREEIDPELNMRVTYTTFEVEDTLKGVADQPHVIKQMGGKKGNERMLVQGVLAFKPGQSYIVFLYGVSEQGFSSPVGLDQGRAEPHAAGRRRGECECVEAWSEYSKQIMRAFFLI